MWHEHELGEYPTLGVSYEDEDEYNDAPWDYINACESAMDFLNEKMPWHELKQYAHSEDDDIDPQDAEALYTRGFDYEYDKDMRHALIWYRRAAELGHAVAMFNIGLCHELGSGVEQDMEQAINWYIKAAEHGHVLAQFNIAVCYEYGEGVVKDMEQAAKWYHKAAEHGDETSQISLGDFYFNGIGVAKDMIKAVEWYRRAAEQGNAVAQCKLGACYANGAGVNKYPAKAC
jgi:TPR repeat protein